MGKPDAEVPWRSLTDDERLCVMFVYVLRSLFARSGASWVVAGLNTLAPMIVDGALKQHVEAAREAVNNMNKQTGVENDDSRGVRKPADEAP